jgi:hypothetical protein
MTSVPDVFSGGAGVAGSPLEFVRLTGGTSLSSGFNIAANILSRVSKMVNFTANACFIESGWDRRLEECNNQADTITWKSGSLNNRSLVLIVGKPFHNERDLNIIQRQIEYSAEVQNFMRDKTTSLDLYMFLQQETAILYRQAYGLAIKAANVLLWMM